MKRMPVCAPLAETEAAIARGRKPTLATEGMSVSHDVPKPVGEGESAMSKWISESFNLREESDYESENRQ